MSVEGDDATEFTSTSQSALSSVSVLPAVSMLPSEAPSDLSSRVVNVQNDVAAVVDDIVVSAAAAADDGSISTCTTLMSVASSQSTHLCSTTVSVSGDTVDDVQLVEMLIYGNHYIITQHSQSKSRICHYLVMFLIYQLFS